MLSITCLSSSDTGFNLSITKAMSLRFATRRAIASVSLTAVASNTSATSSVVFASPSKYARVSASLDAATMG